MHPRRRDVEEALHELRTTFPGGKLVDHWRGEPARPTPEQKEPREGWLDSLAEALDAALRREAFEPIDIPDARSPPDWEFILAHALKRLGGPVASFPDFSETRTEGEDTFITLGTSYDQLIVYAGPLELHGHVELVGTVVVLGDLIVHGALLDGEPSESGLVVIGDERVRAVRINTDHLVTGHLMADLLMRPRDAEGSWDVGGEVRARLRLDDYAYDDEDNLAADKARRWLGPDLIEEELEDETFLCTQVGSGQLKVLDSPREE
jgi:hypothetical protein